MHDKLLEIQKENPASVLITFGCSWTRGIGTGYANDMSEDEYHTIKDVNIINNRYSFRGLISEDVDAYNLNFSHGGSSNQRQFRYASELFTDESFRSITNGMNIVVVWMITSTARNEMWSNSLNKYNNFKYDVDITELSTELLNEVYNHDTEVKSLNEKMHVWNGFFKSMDIKVLWVDTFNTHAYLNTIPNMVVGDLMTRLTNNIQSSGYHYSSWVNDDNRIKQLLKIEMLNPFTFHPTKLGHKKIAEILKPYVKQLII